MNLPNLLTWLRVLAIPLLVALFYLPLKPGTINLSATVLFVAAAVTDWVDGYLARRLGQTSAFGAFLDPVADKLLVSAALIMLVEFGRVEALVALIIIGREITISALREWMAQIGAQGSVAVHSIGKLKTVSQLVAIPMLLFDGQILGIVHSRVIGTWLIYAAAVLTVWSMFYYLRRAWPYLRESL
ncbi:MAG TPA: CDP-diacylglycerol--glycerol-3-phosphate 3-phosphatidyltransferase [Quisquiliibacterium sp.]|jgi:CDP-diacylglycerol--glycerol-3-phosphate 3-phosphatidyltransferase|nr:CDP-diacylglycerol--glycerol-3-phosphate 3-phosphatidyltransferase [Quisquiliibacterium sp.]